MGQGGGNDFAALQQAQNQILQMQAEQRQNLNIARANSNNLASQQNMMAQAGAMAAMSIAQGQGDYGGPVQGRPLVVDPATQAILGRYGVGQPRTVRSQSQQITPQSVVINNNNITNNNVTVPPNIGGPVQGRPIQFKQQEDSLGRFRNWMNSMMTKQNEDAQRREQEYNRKEWSITKSAEKLIKKIEDHAKSLGEKIDPKRIGSTIGSQIKAIMFMFGLGVLSANWKKILTLVTSIAENFRAFVNYLGLFSDAPGKSKFHKQVIKLLGGDPEKAGETALTAVKKLFLGDGGNDLGILGYVRRYFENFIEDRKNAVKLVTARPPAISSLGFTEALGDIVGYLGKILGAMISGTESAAGSIGSDITTVGRDASGKDFAANENNATMTARVPDEEGKLQEVVSGVATHLDYHPGERVGIEREAGVTSGRFYPGMYEEGSKEYVLGVGTDVNRLINKASNNGVIEHEQLSAAIIDLMNAAKNRKYITVRRDLINSLFREDEIKRFKSEKMIIDVYYKLVSKELDSSQEYASNRVAEAYTANTFLGKMANFGGNVMSGIAGLNFSAIGDLLSFAATGESAGFTEKSLEEDKKRVESINSDRAHFTDNGPIGRFANNTLSLLYRTGASYTSYLQPAKKEEKGAVHLYDINLKMVKEIAKRISGTTDAAEGNTKFFEGVESYLQNVAKNGGAEEVVQGWDTKTTAEYYEDLYAAQAESDARSEALQEEIKGSSLEKSKDEILSIANNVVNTAKPVIEDIKTTTAESTGGFLDEAKKILENTYQGFKDYFKRDSANGESSSIGSPDKKSANDNKILKAINFFKSELGLSSSQAAGLVGSIFAENSVDNSVKSDSGKKELQKSGLPHWNKKEVKDKIINYLRSTSGNNEGSEIEDFSYEDQLKAIAWEMKGRTGFLKEVKNSETAKEVADAVLKEYKLGKYSDSNNNSAIINAEVEESKTSMSTNIIKPSRIEKTEDNVNSSDVISNRPSNQIATTMSLNNLSNDSVQVLGEINTRLRSIDSKVGLGNEIAKINTEAAAKQVDAIYSVGSSVNSRNVVNQSTNREVVRSKTS